jgi:Flp pilus assembly protein TadD
VIQLANLLQEPITRVKEFHKEVVKSFYKPQNASGDPMKRIASFAGFAAVVFLIPAIAFAQQIGQEGTIQGKVLDRDGKPLQGAIARVQNMSTNQIDEPKTNKSGTYNVSGLLQGRYKVTVIVDGYALMTRGETTGDEIFVTSGQEMTVNFDLRKAPNTPPVAAAPLPAANKGKVDKKASEEMRAAFNAGIAAMKAQNYDEAIKQFQLAAEKDSSQAAVFGNLGLAQLRTKKYADAVTAFKKSIALNPGDAGVHGSLTLALIESGKIEEAQQEAEEVAKLDPSKAAQSYYNLGATLSEKGKSKEAVELYKKAIEINPKYAPPYYQLGVAYFTSTDTIPAAIPILEKYIQLEPGGQNSEAAKQLLNAAKAGR